MPKQRTEHVTAQVDAAEPLLVDVRGAAELLGISERHTWRLVHTGQLPTKQLGRRRLVPYAALVAYVAALPD